MAQSSPEHPLVTVVTAVFDGQLHMADCLESVLGQDYPNIEHLVMDGGSADGTVDVLRQYDNSIALWKSEPDKGVYDAWNKALAQARGEWICFLGADDEFLPAAVGIYGAGSQTSGSGIPDSQVRWVHPSGYVNAAHGRAWTWRTFARCFCVAHPGSMHRRSLYDRLGVLYDTSYRSAADYELLLRARETLKTAYMPVPTAIMRAGGMSDTSTVLSEAYRAKRQFRRPQRNPRNARPLGRASPLQARSGSSRHGQTGDTVPVTPWPVLRRHLEGVSERLEPAGQTPWK